MRTPSSRTSEQTKLLVVLASFSAVLVLGLYLEGNQPPPTHVSGAVACAHVDRHTIRMHGGYDPIKAYDFGLRIQRLVAEENLPELLSLGLYDLRLDPFAHEMDFEEVFSKEWSRDVLADTPACAPYGWRGFYIGSGGNQVSYQLSDDGWGIQWFVGATDGTLDAEVLRDFESFLSLDALDWYQQIPTYLLPHVVVGISNNDGFERVAAWENKLSAEFPTFGDLMLEYGASDITTQDGDLSLHFEDAICWGYHRCALRYLIDLHRIDDYNRDGIADVRLIAWLRDEQDHGNGPSTESREFFVSRLGPEEPYFFFRVD